MKLLSVLVFVFAAFSASAAPVTDASRFSRTLAPEECTAIGLNRLSSDQLGVLDALVRRDAAYVPSPRAKTPRAARFSQRLSPDERHNAGLTVLDETQLVRLDEDVARFSGPAEFSTSGGGTAPSANVAVLSEKTLRPAPEIHGMISLMFGVGSHGYSERGGAMVLSYEDPANHFAIDVGYAEVHSKGGYLNRACRDTYFDRSLLPNW